MQKKFKEALKQDEQLKNKATAAKFIGTAVANDLIAQGIKRVAYDTSGFPYHGHVKTIAESAREAGLEF